MVFHNIPVFTACVFSLGKQKRLISKALRNLLKGRVYFDGDFRGM